MTQWPVVEKIVRLPPDADRVDEVPLERAASPRGRRQAAAARRAGSRSGRP